MLTDSQKAEVTELLPHSLSSALFRCNEPYEEIRLIAGAPLTVTSNNLLKYVSDRGLLTNWMTNCPFVTQEDVRIVYEGICRKSKFEQHEQLLKGHVVTESGIRVGVAGQAVYSDNVLKNITQISALILRFTHCITGNSQQLIDTICVDGMPESTLIISEPYMGKTTLLRDICSLLSSQRIRVCVVDDNYELMCSDGILGRNTVVIRGFDKLSGAELCVRNLAPQVIVFDEITSESDTIAACRSALMGVAVIATCHARSFNDIMHRQDIYNAIKRGIFRHIALISGGLGNISKIVTAEDLCKEFSVGCL